jgi:protein TonB
MQNCPPLEVDDKVQYSKLIERIEPVYPQAALRNRISGNVELLLTIDEDGIVEQIKPISGHPLLISAAVTAVQQWKYSPTLVNGEAVPVMTTVTVIFGLR